VIGYLSVKNIGNKFTGGLLVVDQNGIPQEFKYSEPVTPTKLQRIIYGKALEKYLSIEVIAKTLLSKSETRPAVVLTDDVNIVEAADNVFHISKTASEKEGIKRVDEGEYVIASPGSSYRLMGNSDLSEDVLNDILSLSESIDLLEPFQRLQKALEYVCSEQ